jgi:IgA Peptidase M64
LEVDVANEREKFIEDARRLAEDVSTNQTFNTVQPLLNFWAAFSPSKEVCFFDYVLF